MKSSLYLASSFLGGDFQFYQVAEPESDSLGAPSLAEPIGDKSK
jgi:hypothetical protein